MVLRSTIDCGGFLSGRIEGKAAIGDIAVARMRTTNGAEKFVIGVVTAAADDGSVKMIATARKRPSWAYDAQCHVGDRARLRGLTAEQIALTLPEAFTTYEDAHQAILKLVEVRIDMARKIEEDGDVRDM
jgi:hypothetical protein